MTPQGASAGEGMNVSLARMEGKLDQVITDHDRRLAAQEASNAAAQTVFRDHDLKIAAVQGQTAALDRRTGNLEKHQAGAFTRTLQVISPIIAAVAVMITFYSVLIG